MAYVYPFKEAASDKVKAVWDKGKEIPDFDSNVWRWDICGEVMKFNQHGKQTENGWEIDHKKPEAKDGSDDIDNLQPLQWENNRRKSDNYPWSCDD